MIILVSQLVILQHPLIVRFVGLPHTLYLKKKFVVDFISLRTQRQCGYKDDRIAGCSSIRCLPCDD